MKKFVNVLIIALVTLVMLCACQPTPENNNKGGGADLKVLDTFEKYTSAIEAIKKADTSGHITVGYASENTDWGYDGSSYDTPEFYATVKKAVMFDEYSLKLEMKGGNKYFYIINSKHCDNAMDDATAMWNELKKRNNK